MSNTPEVAMTVIEPGGRRWAQLLNVNWSVRDLLPLIISRLDLPERINYELQHVRSERVLKQGDTLQSIGIVAGEELQLKPVRDKLLIDLLNGLYGEAVGYVAKQLWGQAESRLETILRLDPEFPDPKGIRRALAERPSPPGSTSYSGSGPVAAKPSGSPPPSGGPQAGPSTAQAPKAPARPRSACSILAILLGGLVLLVVVLAAAGFAWFVLRPSESSGNGTIPLFDDEPVLGTGDVQVTLRWDNTSDLDLHIVDPSGEEIWYSRPSSTSGGQLDVDANGDCSGDPPVENVFWPAGGAPVGNYQVSVVYYGSCDSSGSTNYEVTILVDGQTVEVQNGTLTSVGESQFIGDFTR